MRSLRRSFRILESTKLSEYNALSSVDKEIYKLMISCGLINLEDGSPMKTKLWNMFGEGTTTRTNIETLLEAPPIEE